jgi:hypothetical protein
VWDRGEAFEGELKIGPVNMVQRAITPTQRNSTVVTSFGGLG